METRLNNYKILVISNGKRDWDYCKENGGF